MKKFYFSKQGRRFAKIVALAQKLEKDLSWVPSCTNGMDRIVEFFQLVSEAQDKFEDLSAYTYFSKYNEETVTNLQKFFSLAGRCRDGWNRTVKGETPNSDNVYINMLVPYDEMYLTRTVRDHLARRHNPIGEVDSTVKDSARGKWNETGLIEHSFVNPFMKKNYDLLQIIIAEI